MSLESLVRELEAEVKRLREENQRLQARLREYEEPFESDPSKVTETMKAYWRERDWEFDGFGTWSPPGYHIVRPGKIQKDDE